MSKKLNISNGLHGSKTVRTSTAVITSAKDNGPWSAIQIIEDASFLKLTDTQDSGDSLVGAVIKAGQTLYGNFTEVQRNAGIVRLYKAKPQKS